MVRSHVVNAVCCLKTMQIALWKFHIYFPSVYYKCRYHSKDHRIKLYVKLRVLVLYFCCPQKKEKLCCCYWKIEKLKSM